MRDSARRFLSIVFLVIAFGRGAALAKPLRFIDDRQQPITSSLEICFQVGTRNDCSTRPKGEPVDIPAEWAGVRVEGPDHGPVSAKWVDLKPGPDGLPVLVVPRKAVLQVVADAKERIAVSLYAQDDPTFRSPSFRIEVQGGKSVRIPAGDHLISLLTQGRAPDLHLLSALPASQQHVPYSLRSGWSFVARTLSEKERTPVSSAKVKLQAAEGFGGPGGKKLSKLSLAGPVWPFSRGFRQLWPARR